ncbi:MAG TPA: bifunctional lysylphosphatidylglycerol flippase/synthetase MprF [Candidatus Polarisedimenticolia bacterium]|jgi:phosphatidylglycerol lysyltransferase
MNGAEDGKLRPDPTALTARLAGLWPWVVVAALAWLGWHELRKIDVSEVRAILRGTETGLFLTLLVATALNLAVFGLYDVAALGPRKRPPSRGARWAVGVVSFAWSNFLTVGPMAGPALRLWLYRPLGVEGARARAALTAILTSFSLTLMGWCGAAAIPLPGPLDSGIVRIALSIPMMGLVAAALRWIPRWRLAPPSFRQWEGSPLALAAVSWFDWLVAWYVFHLALSGLHGGIKPGHSMSAFFLGQLIGLASFIPGGFGSADAFWLFSLSAEAGGHDHVLAALLLYRCVYYLLPWAIATLVLAGRLIPTGRRTGAFLRTAIASYTFLCGAILLVSAATPGLAGRVAFLRETVPLSLVEVSHGISIALGFLLLVISRGLARGYRGSHRLALGFFLAAALTTFLKGLDFEEALLALAAVVLLLVFHRAFAREGRLAPPAEFLVSIAAFAIVLFAAVGFGSISAPPKMSVIFGRFGFLAYEARFLRGLVLLTSIAAIAGLHLALRARPADRLPDDAEIGRAVEEVRAWSASTNSLLVACGDKEIFRAPTGRHGAGPAGFIPYRTAGRFLVAYSDPVCPPGVERELLAAFMEHAASTDRDVILYQISAAFLPVAHDFGLTFFKLGEEAIVDLARFDLKGNKAKTWRHSINLVEKTGGSFEILDGAGLEPLLPELRAISDEWLADKHVAEKRFSIGCFSEPYMRRFPCAVVRDVSGRVIAFANVLQGRPDGELSIDLMRYSVERERAAGLKDAMDYLFLKLMLHGKERGYARFNLGMAPLAAVGEERWARPMERLAHLFFRHGEQWYNYQGLRRYKEKFDPVWEPRYMGYPRPWDWPVAVASTAVLIAGGWRALVAPRGEAR